MAARRGFSSHGSATRPLRGRKKRHNSNAPVVAAPLRVVQHPDAAAVVIEAVLDEQPHHADRPAATDGPTVATQAFRFADTVSEIGQAEGETFERLSNTTRDQFARSTQALSTSAAIISTTIDGVSTVARAATRSVEALFREAFETPQRFMDDTRSALETMARARSPVDLLKAQTDLVKAQYEVWATFMARAGEISVNAAEEICASWDDCTSRAGEQYRQGLEHRAQVSVKEDFSTPVHAVSEQSQRGS